MRPLQDRARHRVSYQAEEEIGGPYSNGQAVRIFGPGSRRRPWCARRKAGEPEIVSLGIELESTVEFGNNPIRQTSETAGMV